MKNKKKSILAFALIIGTVSLGSLAGCASRNETRSQIDTSTSVLDTGIDPDRQDERIYCIGSVSKVYVTTAVMQLVDRGSVDIDEPVTTYIPDFTVADERFNEITVRMLMDHTSGIMGTSTKDMFLYDDNFRDKDKLLTSLSSQRLMHEPGEYAAYCNDGFDLLEKIVENVTGMDYTDYVVKNIAAPVGAKNTGSALTLFENELNAPSTLPGNIPWDQSYSLMIGAGGINATASDVANFGSAFFEGNNVLLSDEAKEKMATRWNDEGKDTDIYKDQNGLGWDYVENLAYKNAGVKVLGKGGDVAMHHAFLLVAPDEEVSVSVLTSGGSSNANGLMAEALLDVVLNERGIDIDHSSDRSYELMDEVPKEYRSFEGFYVFSAMSGPEYAYVSFDDKQMHVKYLNFENERKEDYCFTADGGFIKVDEDKKPSIDFSKGRFTENENGVYLTAETDVLSPGLGTNTYLRYVAERIKPEEANMAAVDPWNRIGGRKAVLFSDRFSSAEYDLPFAEVNNVEDLPGYVYVRTGRGGRPLKIMDETTAVSFTTLPCSSNRDMIDVKLSSYTFAPGANEQDFELSDGYKYRFVDELPVFDKSVSEVELRDDEAQWFTIGEDMAGGTIRVNRPENSSIYVYNKYQEVVYSTHMIGADEYIPLPSGGYIMFAGLTGSVVHIN